MYVLAGLRQAAVVCALLTAASAALAALWVLGRGGAYDHRLGAVLMVVAALVCLTSGTDLSRQATLEVRAFLGAGPDREVPWSGEALTPVGVALLIGLPLFLAGGLLLG